MASFGQIMGKVNPALYAENFDELKKKYVNLDEVPTEEIKEKPLSKHNFVYDSSSETLEPVYFYILDLMNDFGLEPEKVADNFTSSPGSGHFAELGQRATVMQQQGAKILGDVNTVLRSVLNIIYDLKEFRIRLSSYEALKNDRREAAILSLKQIWMDKVDINKGNSSIKAMGLGQAGFQTLIDAFLFIKDEKLEGPDGKEIDLNERVKRILRARILEFNDWLGQSEKELKKRYELEKTYLRSQVNSLKLYSRWARPYLKAAQELEMKDRGREAALVTAFNTILLELTLLGKKKIDIREKIASGEAPKGFETLPTRDYYSCVLVDFRFRGIPQRISQQSHYVFGGRAEISFKSFSLNDDELKKFEEEMKKSEMADVLGLIEGATGENLKHLQEEIDFFLEDKEDEEKNAGNSDTSNPFKALIGGYDDISSPKKKEEEKKKEKEPEKRNSFFRKLLGLPPKSEKPKSIKIRSESYAEKEYLRPISGTGAQALAFKLFDVYKKTHGMPSYSP